MVSVWPFSHQCWQSMPCFYTAVLTIIVLQKHESARANDFLTFSSLKIDLPIFLPYIDIGRLLLRLVESSLSILLANSFPVFLIFLSSWSRGCTSSVCQVSVKLQ